MRRPLQSCRAALVALRDPQEWGLADGRVRAVVGGQLISARRSAIGLHRGEPTSFPHPTQRWPQGGRDHLSRRYYRIGRPARAAPLRLSCTTGRPKRGSRTGAVRCTNHHHHHQQPGRSAPPLSRGRRLAATIRNLRTHDRQHQRRCGASTVHRRVVLSGRTRPWRSDRNLDGRQLPAEPRPRRMGCAHAGAQRQGEDHHRC